MFLYKQLTESAVVKEHKHTFQDQVEKHTMLQMLLLKLQMQMCTSGPVSISVCVCVCVCVCVSMHWKHHTLMWRVLTTGPRRTHTKYLIPLCCFSSASLWDTERETWTSVHTSHLVNFWSLHVGSGTNMGMAIVCLGSENKQYARLLLQTRPWLIIDIKEEEVGVGGGGDTDCPEVRGMCVAPYPRTTSLSNTSGPYTLTTSWGPVQSKSKWILSFLYLYFFF